MTVLLKCGIFSSYRNLSNFDGSLPKFGIPSFEITTFNFNPGNNKSRRNKALDSGVSTV
jgi:hypothetical protein